MRRLIAGLACLLLFAGGWWIGKGQTATPGLDGSGWKLLSDAQHALYLLGFKQGYVHGHVSGFKQGLERGQKLSPVAHVFDSSDAARLEPTVSVFYRDSRNISVCWEEAIMLSAASLAGNAPTEQELNAARKAGAEKGCR